MPVQDTDSLTAQWTPCSWDWKKWTEPGWAWLKDSETRARSPRDQGTTRSRGRGCGPRALMCDGSTEQALVVSHPRPG